MAKAPTKPEAGGEAAPKGKSKLLIIIVIVLLVLLIIVAGGIGALLLLKNKGSSDDGASAPAAAAANSPGDLFLTPLSQPLKYHKSFLKGNGIFIAPNLNASSVYPLIGIISPLSFRKHRQFKRRNPRGQIFQYLARHRVFHPQRTHFFTRAHFPVSHFAVPPCSNRF